MMAKIVSEVCGWNMSDAPGYFKEVNVKIMTTFKAFPTFSLVLPAIFYTFMLTGQS